MDERGGSQVRVSSRVMVFLATDPRNVVGSAEMDKVYSETILVAAS